jgi:hypothetical protein
LQEDLDGLRIQNDQLQEALDVLKSQHSQQKQKIRAVARVAVKKQKHSKHEVVRLRDQVTFFLFFPFCLFLLIRTFKRSISLVENEQNQNKFRNCFSDLLSMFD